MNFVERLTTNRTERAIQDDRSASFILELAIAGAPMNLATLKAASDLLEKSPAPKVAPGFSPAMHFLGAGAAFS